MKLPERPDRRFSRTAVALLAAGVIAQAWLCLRGGIGGDQYVLFDLGLDYLDTGRLKAFGKGMSGGGIIPGALLQLLIGVPLSLWRDYRSPVALIGLFHLVAGVLALITIHRAAGARPALLFLALFWLSPWRLYHSGFLWEPAYVVLPAAVHLWACHRLRARPGNLESAILTATLVAAFQLHGSFLYLVILTVILRARKLIALPWKGAIPGAAVGALTLVPTVFALLQGTLPALGPSKSFFGFGLLTVAPVLRSFLYWFRLGSLDIGRRLQGVVFLDDGWAGGEPLRLLLRGGTALLVVLSAVSVLVALFASAWYFRRVRRVEGRDPEWLWFRSYALCGLVSLLVAGALSPVTIQGWHVLIALPAASLPMAFWMAEIWPPRWRWLRWGLVIFLVLRVPEVAVLGFGHEMYRMDSDIASKLQLRQRTLLPDHLQVTK